jgi:hypothetical protein
MDFVMMSLANVIAMKDQDSEEETRRDSIVKNNAPSKVKREYLEITNTLKKYVTRMKPSHTARHHIVCRFYFNIH